MYNDSVDKGKQLTFILFKLTKDTDQNTTHNDRVCTCLT